MGQVNPIQAQKFLSGVDYPASKNELVETARRQGADDRVLDALNAIADRQYDGPNAVSAELGSD